MSNLINKAYIASGLTIRDIAILTDKWPSVVHRLVKNPGEARRPTELIKIGKIIGLSEAEVIAEWKRCRAARQLALIQKVGADE